MTEDQMSDAAYDLARRLSKVCDGENAAVVLAAMATIVGQSIWGVASANKIAPQEVLDVFFDDVKNWTVKYIAFHIEETVLAPAEKAATNPVEH